MLWRKLILGRFGEEPGGWYSRVGTKVMVWAYGNQLEKGEEILNPKQDLGWAMREE